MSEETHLTDVEAAADTPEDEMVAAYRHHTHKLTGDSHEYAPETFAGVSVNQPVPYGADGDAAALSRPSGQPDQTVATHGTHYRLSLLTGESRYAPTEFTRADVEDTIRRLLTENDPETIHHTWLDSDVACAFNESVYYPYTSLKYHTLLVVALLDNYRDGHTFSDLYLVVDPADERVSYRTVYVGESFGLRIGANYGDRPCARLGSRPW